MPRQARLDVPGTLHHVVIRGIEGRLIVDDEKDRGEFVSRLGNVAMETETRIYAWALMTNHAHILLRSGPAGLPKLMRRLLTGYAVTYNRRHFRHGHLFQNRYQSIVCDEDSYFQELVRYIHLNPLRAKVVNNLLELDHYPWCGHGVIMGYIKQEWQDSDYVLSWFGKREGEARRVYRRYIEEGLNQGYRPELIGGELIRSSGGWSAVLTLRRSRGRLEGDQRILGNEDFMENVLKDSASEVTNRFASTKRKNGIQGIIDAACRREGINITELRMGSRRGRIPRVRSEIAIQLLREYGIPLAQIARELGVSTSAISKLLVRRTESPPKADKST